jgi:hypothetical protein
MACFVLVRHAYVVLCAECMQNALVHQLTVCPHCCCILWSPHVTWHAAIVCFCLALHNQGHYRMSRQRYCQMIL